MLLADPPPPEVVCAPELEPTVSDLSIKCVAFLATTFDVILNHGLTLFEEWQHFEVSVKSDKFVLETELRIGRVYDPRVRQPVANRGTFERQIWVSLVKNVVRDVRHIMASV